MQTAPTYRQSGGDEPLISFIIADYNVPAELLRECLDSIFALSLSDGERGGYRRRRRLHGESSWRYYELFGQNNIHPTT